MQRSLILAVFLVFLSINTQAWDDVGHKISAYIAWQRMSPAARENVVRILRSAPEDSNLAAFYQNYGATPEQQRKKEFFMFTATWADVVRDRAFENRYKKYHKSNWHYDDTFWRQNGSAAVPLTGFEEGGVAVDRLIEFDKTIRDAGASDRDKAIAIAWIMHLVGDLHQPLHTSARVTDTEPKGDQGGNLFHLTPQGTKREDQVNLHWFWDSIVVRSTPPKTGEFAERDYIEPIAERIMRKHTFASVQAGLKPGDYRALQQESFAHNPTVVFSSDLVRFQMPPVKYKRNAFNLAERQLALAGYRMGEIFNTVFGNAPAAAAPRAQ
jgi:hypothetical protein